MIRKTASSPLPCASFCVQPVNDSATRAVRQEFPDQPGRVQLVLEAEERCAVQPLQLDRALGHLLRNARQAVRDGQGIRIRTWDGDGGSYIEVSDDGVDLVLTGHMHDGQITVPLPRDKVRLAHPRAPFAAGMYTRDGIQMHVSPGLGTTFVPFRFYARPEATELVLTPQ